MTILLLSLYPEDLHASFRVLFPHFQGQAIRLHDYQPSKCHVQFHMAAITENSTFAHISAFKSLKDEISVANPIFAGSRKSFVMFWKISGFILA